MIKLGMMEPAGAAVEAGVTFESCRDLLRGAKELTWMKEQTAGGVGPPPRGRK